MTAQATAQDDWETHWVRYAAMARKNPAQAFRRKIILDALAQNARGTMRVLDVGSGLGDMSADIAARFADAEIMGVDLSAEAVRFASERAPRGKFFQQNMLEPLAVPAEYRNWASHAVCSEVLEHVEQPEKFLQNLQGLLAPGATLVVTVPGGPRTAFDKHIGHRRHYDRADLGALFGAAGYETVSVEAAGFPFFNVYKLSVLLRGKKLIDEVASDASSSSAPENNWLANAALKTFGVLFKANQDHGRLGWQLIGVARVPAGKRAGGVAT
ncbi:MAG: class I SAM-dependent methyltransferase [Polyangiaceae bacterium]